MPFHTAHYKTFQSRQQTPRHHQPAQQIWQGLKLNYGNSEASDDQAHTLRILDTDLIDDKKKKNTIPKVANFFQ